MTQLCPAVREPIRSSLPGSSVRAISLGRIREWVAISYSRDLLTQDSDPRLLCFLHWQVDPYHWRHLESLTRISALLHLFFFFPRVHHGSHQALWAFCLARTFISSVINIFIIIDVYSIWVVCSPAFSISPVIFSYVVMHGKIQGVSGTPITLYDKYFYF